MIKYLTLLLILTISNVGVADNRTNFKRHEWNNTHKSVKKHKVRKQRVPVPKLLGDEIILPVISIYDGDTIMSSLTLPPPINAISIRINGMDTPERPAKSYRITGKLGRAKCDQEAELALAATTYLQSLQDQYGGAMTVKNFKYGAYAGRIVGDVYIGGVNIAEQMIGLGYAVPYDGKSKRSKDWCKIQ